MLARFNGLAVKLSGEAFVRAPNASIEVLREDTGAAAAIFSDEAGTVPITNPSDFTDANGFFSFYAEGLERGYRIQGTDGALIFDLRNVAVGTFAHLDNPMTAAGDIIVGGVNGVPTRLASGLSAFTKLIHGLTYANNAGDATNDIDIAAGGAMDATGIYWMASAAITKRSDAVWAVGSNQGALDTGVVGNSDYYIWLIARLDTGVVDVLFSLSSTAPTMPADYDFKRLIGWFKRVGGTIVAFHTYELEGGGLDFAWDAPTTDVNLSSTLTTTRRTDAVKVPLGFSVVATLNVRLADASATVLWVTSPDTTDAAASFPASSFIIGAGEDNATTMRVRTGSTGLIASRASVATVDTYQVSTFNFQWARRN